MKKYAINRDYGSFGLSFYNTDHYRFTSYRRDDEKLIAFLENPYNAKYVRNIKIVLVPDDATDTLLVNDDGYETLYYVQNGLIYAAEEEEEED